MIGYINTVVFQPMSSRRSVYSLVFLFVALHDQRRVDAAGFSAARFGGEQGHPTTTNPTALYYNPAGIARTRGTVVYFEGLFAYRTASYERPAGAIDNVLTAGETGEGTPVEVAEANYGESTLSNSLASPFLGVVSDLGVPNLGVGLALYVPFGGQAMWDQNERFRDNLEHPGAVDGVQRWWTIDGTLRAIYVTAAGAYRLPKPRLSFGLGVNLVISQVQTLRARTALGTDDLVTADGSLQEGRSLIDVNDNSLSLGAGVTWEPRGDLVLGLSYQSQPGFGEQALTGDLYTKLGAATQTVGPTELTQSLPDIVRFGATWRQSDRLELRVFGDYTRWSVFDRQCVLDATVARSCTLTATGAVDTAGGGGGVVAVFPRDWQDTFGLRVGGTVQVTKGLGVDAGLGWDGNAVPDETMDPALIDMNKITLSAGARYDATKTMFVYASLLQVLYLDRDVPVRTTAPETPSRSPDAAGAYSQSLSAFGLGVGYQF
jgi:long-chain fatty acid transport protein